MRKIAILSAICILLSSVFLCTGCGKKGNNGDNGKTPVGNEEIVNPSDKESGNEIDKEGKTVITWMVSRYYGAPPADDEVYVEFNKLLDKKGYDIYVEFYTPEKDLDDYTNEIYDAVKEKRVDIFHTGYDYYGSLYADLVRDGMCHEITGYMQEPEGEILYNIQDEMSWEALRVDGKLYAVTVASAFTEGDVSYYVNQSIAEKYEIDCERLLEDNAYFWDSMLRVEEGEKGNEEFIPYIRLAIYLYDYPLNLFELCRPIGICKDAEGKYKAVNIYEDERVRESIISSREMYNRGKMFGGGNEWQKQLETGDFFVAVGVPDSDYPDTEKYISEPCICGKAGMVNCISSGSENKEAAFELLCAVYTDRELSEMLAYGIEGKHYKVENDKIYKTATTYAGRRGAANLLTNIWILRESDYGHYIPVPLSEEEKQTLEINPLFNHPLDLRNLKQQLLELQRCALDNFPDNADGWAFKYESEPDFNKIYDEALMELKKAGIDEVLNELNKQLQEKGLQ